jgi:hypothetical protein
VRGGGGGRIPPTHEGGDNEPVPVLGHQESRGWNTLISRPKNIGTILEGKMTYGR